MSWPRIKLLIWKEFRQLRRDRMLLPLVFLQPILQLIMFGYVVGSDVTNIQTAIIDQDRSVLSREVETAFANVGYFEIAARPASEAAMRPLMDSEQIQIAVVIPPGFSDALERRETANVQLIVDGADSKTASVASGYATQLLADFAQSRAQATGLVPEGAGIDARVRVLFNPTLRSVNAMVPGLVAFILMLSSMGLMSQAVVRERERGTLEQMFVTPITRGEYLWGKLTPYILLSAVQIVFVMAIGIMWFRVPFYGDLFVIAAGMLLFMFSTLGTGLLISTVSKTRHQALQMTMFYMIPTIVLSGFIFPVESMPAPVVPVTYLIPLRYALVILRSNFMKGSGFEALWPEFAAMAVFSLAIFGFALSRFQKRLAD